ncbi:MAG TPA: hypothetical protein VKH46_04825 [Thermoanaerobaculia bacterium]|jgi:hypothetical protein|nr:hypothetical protein [Thermoanaerobaculia bacterium]
MNTRTLLLTGALLAPAAGALAAGALHDRPMAAKGSRGHADCPMAAGDSAAHGHAGSSASRADEGMGFSQAKTTHHFRLCADGGSIEVTANDPADEDSRGQIRKHLAHIRKMFAAGNFSIPMFVHDGIPPGTATMKRRASVIRYRYEDIAGGGRVRLSTGDPDALDAIHDFLRFQIVEHETGDPTEVVEGR